MKDLRARWVFIVGIMYKQTRPNVITLFTNESWNTNKMCRSIFKALSFLRKYNLCWPFLYRFIVLSSHLSLSLIVVPRYLYECQLFLCVSH